MESGVQQALVSPGIKALRSCVIAVTTVMELMGVLYDEL